MFILLCSPHSFLLIELLTTSLILISFFFSRIVTEKPHQGGVNKLLYYCINYIALYGIVLLGREVTNGAFPWPQTILKQLEEWHVIVFCDQLGVTLWAAPTLWYTTQNWWFSYDVIKISLKNYRSPEVFTFMKYMSS